MKCGTWADGQGGSPGGLAPMANSSISAAAGRSLHAPCTARFDVRWCGEVNLDSGASAHTTSCPQAYSTCTYHTRSDLRHCTEQCGPPLGQRNVAQGASTRCCTICTVLYPHTVWYVPYHILSCTYWGDVPVCAGSRPATQPTARGLSRHDMTRTAGWQAGRLARPQCRRCPRPTCQHATPSSSHGLRQKPYLRA